MEENFSAIYVYWGEENYLLNEALVALRRKVFADNPQGEAFNYEVAPQEIAAQELIYRLQGLPFGARMRMIVVENCSAFSLESKISEETQRNDKLLLEYLEAPNPQSVLVLVFRGKLDKRKSLYKALEKNGCVQEFAPMKGELFLQWAVKYADRWGKRFTQQALHALALWEGIQLDAMANELDKLCCYVGEREKIEEKDMEMILTPTVEANVFKMIDFLVEKRAKPALELLEQSLKIGEVPLRLLALMVRQYRNLLLIKELRKNNYSEKEIAAKLGLPPFAVAKGIRQGNRLKEEELALALEKLLYAEIELKTSAESKNILERLVVDLC